MKIRSFCIGALVVFIPAVWPAAASVQTFGEFMSAFQRDLSAMVQNDASQSSSSSVRRSTGNRAFRSRSAIVVRTSLLPRARPTGEDLEPLPQVDPEVALTENEKLIKYRDAVLMLDLANDRYDNVSRKRGELPDVRAVDVIQADLAALPANTVMGSDEVQVLLDELAASAERQANSATLQYELLRARQDITRAEIEVAEARAQLLPGEEVDDETIAVLHEMLELPPVR